ncbi:MAG: sporulation protein YtxC [Candidatus Wallacebacter cryptica]
MSVLTISASNSLMESVRSTIDAEFMSASWRSEGRYTFIDLPRGPEFRSDLKITNTLAAIIFGQLSRLWLKRLLRLNYAYFDEDEQRTILQNAYKKMGINSGQLYQQVYSALADYLISNNQINLEGFIRFRVKEFWLFLQELVDKAVDEFLEEQEYQEFVKLLHYFVELQEPKTELINVIVDQPNGFQILDHNGNVIETDHLEDVILEVSSSELDFEDFLISALITIAPAKIILHVCRGDRVEKTIVNIFGSRVYICDGCSLCSDLCNCT